MFEASLARSELPVVVFFGCQGNIKRSSGGGFFGCLGNEDLRRRRGNAARAWFLFSPALFLF